MYSFVDECRDAMVYDLPFMSRYTVPKLLVNDYYWKCENVDSVCCCRCGMVLGRVTPYLVISGTKSFLRGEECNDPKVNRLEFQIFDIILNNQIYDFIMHINLF